MSQLPIALGLYSLNNTLFTDTANTLKAVKEMGYDGVEFYGPFSLLPQTLRTMLADNGLALVGWHVALDALEGINYGATLAYVKALELKALVVPHLAAETATEWAAMGKRMGEAAARLKGEGIALGYHNHAHEFTGVTDGKRHWDTLVEAMGEGVFLQIDTGNAMEGGADVMAEFTRFSGRHNTLHFKPYKKGAPDKGFATMFGSDDHDLKALVGAARTGGAKWLILEYECGYTYTQKGGAREALRHFKAALH